MDIRRDVRDEARGDRRRDEIGARLHDDRDRRGLGRAITGRVRRVDLVRVGARGEQRIDVRHGRRREVLDRDTIAIDAIGRDADIIRGRVPRQRHEVRARDGLDVAGHRGRRDIGLRHGHRVRGERGITPRLTETIEDALLDREPRAERRRVVVRLHRVAVHTRGHIGIHERVAGRSRRADRETITEDAVVRHGPVIGRRDPRELVRVQTGDTAREVARGGRSRRVGRLDERGATGTRGSGQIEVGVLVDRGLGERHRVLAEPVDARVGRLEGAARRDTHTTDEARDVVTAEIEIGGRPVVSERIADRIDRVVSQDTLTARTGAERAATVEVEQRAVRDHAILELVLRDRLPIGTDGGAMDLDDALVHERAGIVILDDDDALARDTGDMRLLDRTHQTIRTVRGVADDIPRAHLGRGTGPATRAGMIHIDEAGEAEAARERLRIGQRDETARRADDLAIADELDVHLIAGEPTERRDEVARRERDDGDRERRRLVHRDRGRRLRQRDRLDRHRLRRAIADGVRGVDRIRVGARRDVRIHVHRGRGRRTVGILHDTDGDAVAIDAVRGHAHVVGGRRPGQRDRVEVRERRGEPRGRRRRHDLGARRRRQQFERRAARQRRTATDAGTDLERGARGQTTRQIARAHDRAHRTGHVGRAQARERRGECTGIGEVGCEHALTGGRERPRTQHLREQHARAGRIEVAAERDDARRQSTDGDRGTHRAERGEVHLDGIGRDLDRTSDLQHITGHRVGTTRTRAPDDVDLDDVPAADVGRDPEPAGGTRMVHIDDPGERRTERRTRIILRDDRIGGVRAAHGAIGMDDLDDDTIIGVVTRRVHEVALGERGDGDGGEGWVVGDLSVGRGCDRGERGQHQTLRPPGSYDAGNVEHGHGLLWTGGRWDAPL